MTAQKITVLILPNHSRKQSKIKLLIKDKNQGKGSVLVEGFKNVDTKYCAIHDADLEYFPKDFTSMFEKINEKTIVLGSRFIEILRKYLYKNFYCK